MLEGVTSESARAPSPWDELLQSSTPPADSAGKTASPTLLPKLVPEVEEGSVEYKLKLLDPSPARFARLVTQLKWRLLEGHGQAYYEIGVADSGLLIGLPKHDLEKSLETLEEMAGEIGASVIIVKEIEIPEDLVRLAEQSEQLSKLTNPRPGEDEEDEVAEQGQGSRLGSWDRRSKRLPISSSLSSVTSISTTGSDFSTENEASTTDDDGGVPNKTYSALDLDLSTLASVDDRLDVETERTLFNMDLDLEHAPSPPVFVAPPPLGLLAHTHAVDLSIASVFKPRPGRNRHMHTHTKVDRRQVKWEKREKKVKTDWATIVHGSHHHANPHVSHSYKRSRDEKSVLGVDGVSTKAEKRRMARDARREEKRRGQMPVGHSVDIPAREVEKRVHELAHALEGMHVGLATASSHAEPAPLISIEQGGYADGLLQGESEVKEARHILEVLVVKKMSVEEAYGDFGFEGFEVE